MKTILPDPTQDKTLPRQYRGLPVLVGRITGPIQSEPGAFRQVAPGQSYIEVECEYCGRTHTHGWIDSVPPETLQHKIGHCDGGTPGKSDGYYVTLEWKGAS